MQSKREQLQRQPDASKKLDATYLPADIKEVAKKLKDKEQQKILLLLTKYKPLSDRLFGRWQGDTYKTKLHGNIKQHHVHPYSIPHGYKAILKMEVERLCKVDVLKKINRLEWAAPIFMIPKKDMIVQFISNFRKLNKRIKENILQFQKSKTYC